MDHILDMTSEVVYTNAIEGISYTRHGTEYSRIKEAGIFDQMEIMKANAKMARQQFRAKKYDECRETLTNISDAITEIEVKIHEMPDDTFMSRICQMIAPDFVAIFVAFGIIDIAAAIAKAAASTVGGVLLTMGIGIGTAISAENTILNRAIVKIRSKDAILNMLEEYKNLVYAMSQDCVKMGVTDI